MSMDMHGYKLLFLKQYFPTVVFQSQELWWTKVTSQKQKKVFMPVRTAWQLDRLTLELNLGGRHGPTCLDYCGTCLGHLCLYTLHFVSDVDDSFTHCHSISPGVSWLGVGGYHGKGQGEGQNSSQGRGGGEDSGWYLILDLLRGQFDLRASGAGCLLYMESSVSAKLPCIWLGKHNLLAPSGNACMVPNTSITLGKPWHSNFLCPLGCHVLKGGLLVAALPGCLHAHVTGWRGGGRKGWTYCSATSCLLLHFSR